MIKLTCESDLKHNCLKLTYLVSFMIFLFIRVTSVWTICVPAFVDAVVFLLLMVLGLFVVIVDVFRWHLFFRAVNSIWLMLFLFSVMFSIVINIQYGIAGNVRSWLWMLIEFVVVYSVDYSLDEKVMFNQIKLVEHVFMVLCLIGAIVSITMFFLRIGKYVELDNEKHCIYGFVENRLFGCYGDPNYAAIVSLIAIIFSLKNYVFSSKGKIKLIYLINIFLQFVYIVLSGSRTGDVAMICAGFLGFFLYSRFNCKKNWGSNKTIKSFFISFFYGLLACVILLVLLFIIKRFSIYLANLIDSAIKNNVSFGKESVISLNRLDVTESSDISNLRFKIWLSALEIFKSRPIFGVTERNVVEYAVQNFENGFIAVRKYSYIHNFYISVLVCTGIVGAVFIFGFLIKNVIRILKELFNEYDQKIYLNKVFCFLPVVVVAVSGVFLTDILFINYAGSFLFWLYMGYSIYLTKCSNKENNNEDCSIYECWCRLQMKWSKKYK